MKKRLPIGISDFKNIIDNDYAYVDKTLFIEELVEKSPLIALIPRLRRFGKTLNLSMVRYFFEKAKEDTSYLFQNLKIWENEKCRELQGKYPVIFLSLKDIKHSSWDNTFAAIQELIAGEFRKHRYLLDGEILAEEEKEIFKKIIFNKADRIAIEKSLFFLSEWLHRYSNQRVILLIDEYDTPAHAAYVGKYYDTLIGFLRNWLSTALKDNPYLERGVLTGILRIAKESIFSGLNNVLTFTILDQAFQDKFGLLESEVQDLLEKYNLIEKLPQIKEWYNGYRIGSCDGIYNPWSVLNCIQNNGALAPYWVNTSDNAIIKQLIAQGTEDLKADLAALMKGEVIDLDIEEGVVFSELDQNPSAIWSLLLYCGYLTLDETRTYGKPCRLRIPNTEIKELYKSMILNWFNQSIHKHKYLLLLSSLTSGDIDTFSQIFQEFMISSVSVFDVPATESEKIYHGFVLGMLVGLSDRYEVKSNRESGFGRYDVMLIPKDARELGIIMEFKKVGRFENSTIEEAVESALKQIEERQYAQELIDRGIHRILFLGFAFEGKEVLIRSKSKAS